jgi:DNA-binding response OmpR family regulator
MDSKALIIGMDEENLDRVVELLEGAGWSAKRVIGSVEGLLRTLEFFPDLLLLTEETPPIKGEELLPLLRRASNALIVVIGTGGSSEHIKALSMGADVYLRHPVSEAVLVATVKALMRRRSERNTATTQEPDLSSVSALPLSVTERRLVACLLAHKGNIVTSKELLQEAWAGTAGPETLIFYLRQVRRKLAESSANIRLVSVRGLGHRVVSIK